MRSLIAIGLATGGVLGVVGTMVTQQAGWTWALFKAEEGVPSKSTEKRSAPVI